MLNDKNINSTHHDKTDEKTETISELAHRHLKDQKHTTSDEELRNAKVEFSEDADTSDHSLFEVDNTTVTGSTVKTADDRENRTGDDDDVTPPNPYSVLNP